MGDIATKNLERSIQKILDRWWGKIRRPLEDIAKIDAELEKLAAKKDPTPQDEKLRARCQAARKNLVKKVEKATTEMRLELKIVTPPPEAAKSDLDKLVTKVKGLVKTFQKGVPLGSDQLRLKPDVEIDYKKRKFKKLGVILEWKF